MINGKLRNISLLNEEYQKLLNEIKSTKQTYNKYKHVDYYRNFNNLENP